MNQSSILDSLSGISKSGSNLKYRNINTENIKIFIDDLIWELNTLTGIYSSFDKLQQKKIIDRIKTDLKYKTELTKIVGKETVNFVINSDKYFDGHAKQYGIFESIRITSVSLNKTLEDIRKHIDDIFNNKNGVMVGDIRLSHSILLSVIGIVNVFSKFSSYLLGVYSYILMDNKHVNVPRYITDFVVSKGPNCFVIINSIVNSPVNIPILNTITDLRKQGIDFDVSSLDKSSVVVKSAMSKSSTINFVLGLFSKMIDYISAIGEGYVDNRHLYFEEMKERKKWLELHVTNIKMNLENMDQNDPKYIELQAAIVYYENKIGEYDKKLNDYYGDEY